MTFVFTLLVIYQFKHFIADYILQAHPYFLGKFKKDWGFFFPLLAHVAVHGILTLWIVTFASKNLELAWKLALFDGIVHFFMDRIKAGEKYMGRWKPLTGAQYVLFSVKNDDDSKSKLRGNKLFWQCLGLDQLVHHLTHYAIIWMLVK